MSEENTTMNESQFSLISESLESADSECLSALSKKSAILKKNKMLTKPRFYFSTLDTTQSEISKIQYEYKREFDEEKGEFIFVKNPQK